MVDKDTLALVYRLIFDKVPYKRLPLAKLCFKSALS